MRARSIARIFKKNVNRRSSPARWRVRAIMSKSDFIAAPWKGRADGSVQNFFQAFFVGDEPFRVSKGIWKHAFVSAIIMVLALFVTQTGARADCLPSTREVKFQDGSARLKSYVCGLGKGSRPAIQIEFDRLSEVGAGGVVEDSISSELKSVYGSFRVANNDVFLEAKKIFDTYGRVGAPHSDISLSGFSA